LAAREIHDGSQLTSRQADLSILALDVTIPTLADPVLQVGELGEPRVNDPSPEGRGLCKGYHDVSVD